MFRARTTFKEKRKKVRVLGDLGFYRGMKQQGLYRDFGD